MRIISFASVLFSVTATEAAVKCKTQSQPNPIAAQYPDQTTGTINGTIAILPIPYALARKIVPSEYAILRHAYQQWLPSWPKDLYPAVLETELDHDIKYGDITIDDFQRAGISFPFIDRLSDGYTSMMYNNEIILTSTNSLAILGTEAYGQTVIPGSFDPPCDAYAFVSGSGCEKDVYFKAYAVNQTLGLAPLANLKFSPLATREKPQYSMDFWVNVTNQPNFGNNKLFCDNYIRLFNSSVTKAPYKPVAGHVHVTAVKPFFAKTTEWVKAGALKLDNAFIEKNYLSCDTLKGYSVMNAR